VNQLSQLMHEELRRRNFADTTICSYDPGDWTGISLFSSVRVSPVLNTLDQIPSYVNNA
jgi:hypothetical protein